MRFESLLQNVDRGAVIYKRNSLEVGKCMRPLQKMPKACLEVFRPRMCAAINVDSQRVYELGGQWSWRVETP